MRAALDDAAGLEHKDLVGVDDGRETVRDDQRRAPRSEPLERRLNRALRPHVERGRGLVEHEYRRVLEDRPSDCDTLLLAARELEPALADDSVVLLGQRADEVVHVCRLGGRDDLLAGRAAAPIGDVVLDRLVEETRVLGHDADPAAHAVRGKLADVPAVDRDAARPGIVEAHEQPGERRFAGAAAADDGDGAARRDPKIDVPEHLPARLVAEAQVFEAHRGVRDLERRQRPGRVALGRLAQQLEQPLCHDHGIAGLTEHEAQRVQRQTHLNHVGVDEHEVADRHRAREHLAPGQHHDGRDADADDRALTNVQQEQRLLVADVRLDPVAHDRAEALSLEGLVRIELDGVVVEHAVHEPPVRVRVELVDAPLPHRAAPGEYDGEIRVDHERRGDDDREARVVAADHDPDDDGDLDDRRHDREQRNTKQKPDGGGAALHVARQRARRAIRVEPSPKRVQVPKHRERIVGHGALGHAREDQIARLAEQRRRKPQRGVADQQRHGQRDELLGPAQRVHDALEQQGHPDRSDLGHDEQHDGREHARVERPHLEGERQQYFVLGLGLHFETSAPPRGRTGARKAGAARRLCAGGAKAWRSRAEAARSRGSSFDHRWQHFSCQPWTPTTQSAQFRFPRIFNRLSRFQDLRSELQAAQRGSGIRPCPRAAGAAS